MAGALLTAELVGMQGDAKAIGVYVSKGSVAKIGYYLRTDVTLTSTRWAGRRAGREPEDAQRPRGRRQDGAALAR